MAFFGTETLRAEGTISLRRIGRASALCALLDPVADRGKGLAALRANEFENALRILFCLHNDLARLVCEIAFLNSDAAASVR
jgi:hypothetical protein